jgi:RNA polymerase sigma-70 factor (ECF subfamily)
VVNPTRDASVAVTVFDDADLVRAFSDGESWAAREIWNRHAPMVHRLLERALGPHGEADDLMQDVFIRIFATLPKLRHGGALRGFIYTVAFRRLKSEIRRRRGRNILRLSDTGQLPEQAIRGVDSESRQILGRIYGRLEQMRVKHRTAFVLQRIEGLTVEEVADRMRVSPATVKRWISRASRNVSSLVAAEYEQNFPGAL